MASGREIGAEIRNAILRLALAGNNKSEVARRLGISVTAVTRYWPIQGKKNDARKNFGRIEQ
jgi:DNA invertase Pin-like site-specific DNA recombinase